MATGATTVLYADGVWIQQFKSWKTFISYIHDEMLDFNHYVWRGDRCDNRPLFPSFDRKHQGKSKTEIELEMKNHLKIFEEATCGRRGVNPQKIKVENDLWALGQHFGLSTPLLDWTRSPFVGLFFAFEKSKIPQTINRCVYAINPLSCDSRNEAIIKAHVGKDRPDIAEFFRPQQDENSRLLNQNGLFSRCTAGKALDEWVKEKNKGVKAGVIMKMLIPDNEREECLRMLNKMNINQLTLFPDLYGAASFSNMTSSIKMY